MGVFLLYSLKVYLGAYPRDWTFFIYPAKLATVALTRKKKSAYSEVGAYPGYYGKASD